jgi:AraC-like DNA-binding protein
MDPRIRMILRVIDEQRGLDELAPAEAGVLLGISAAYFLRLFQEEVRTTFGRYLREVRMNRAAEQLKDPMLSIKLIAKDSGYEDLSNFYRDFKQVHGMNPKQARIIEFISPSRKDRSDQISVHSLAFPPEVHIP